MVGELRQLNERDMLLLALFLGKLEALREPRYKTTTGEYAYSIDYIHDLLKAHAELLQLLTAAVREAS